MKCEVLLMLMVIPTMMATLKKIGSLDLDKMCEGGNKILAVYNGAF